MPPTLEQPEVTMDTAQATLDKAKAMSGSVSANQLAQPAPVAQVTEPAEAPPVNRGVIDRAAQGTQEFITAQSAEADRLKQLRDEYGAISGEGTLSDMFTQEQDRMGIPQNLRELQDLQLQLADRGTSSQLTQAQIAGKAGQTINEAGRAITQEQRESAIRDAGLAARAQVLQGNIETASTLVNQAVQLAYQDRTLRNTNLINQINDLRGVVDSQTQQLLDREQRKYQEDQAKVQRVQGAVDAAMASGAATPEDVKLLTNPNISDEARLAAAQGIVAQGFSEERDLSMAAKRAGIASTYASIDLAERKFNYEQQQDALDAEMKALQGQGVISEEQAANTQKVESALRLQDLVKQVKGHAGFNLSVGSVGSRIVSLTEGGLAGQAYNYLSGQGEGFDALYDQLTESLTLDNLDKMSGVLTDRDIQVLRSAATRLRKTTTEDEFLNTLNEMDSIFQRTVDENGISPQQAKFYYGVDDDTLSEIDFIYGTESTTPATIGNNFDF